MAKKITGWSKPSGFVGDELQVPSLINGTKVNQINGTALSNATKANGINKVLVDGKSNEISGSPWGSDALQIGRKQNN